MKYRQPPADPDADPIVEATPEEVRALRPAIGWCLLRNGVPRRNVDDLAQNVEIVTWRALSEKRVRGSLLIEPRDALLGFMFAVVRNLAANYRTRACNRFEELASEPEHESERSWDLWNRRDVIAQLEARDLLCRLARHNIAAMLLAAALDEPLEERVKSARMLKSTYFYRLKNARRWFRDVARSGQWRPPPQPIPTRPMARKRKRKQ